MVLHLVLWRLTSMVWRKRSNNREIEAAQVIKCDSAGFSGPSMKVSNTCFSPGRNSKSWGVQMILPPPSKCSCLLGGFCCFVLQEFPYSGVLSLM